MSITLIIVSSAIIGLCMAGIGIGILCFNRKELNAECGTVPGYEEDTACLSQKAGLCPMEDKDGYLKMATTATRLKKRHNKY